VRSWEQMLPIETSCVRLFRSNTDFIRNILNYNYLQNNL